MLLYDSNPNTRCRYTEVSPCDVQGYLPGIDALPRAEALYQMPISDTLDYGLDFGPWIAENGKTDIDVVTWAVAADSPHTPIIVAQSFIATGITNVTISAGVGAEVGNTYYLECTVTFAADAGSATELPIPPRSVKRRIHIVLVRG